MLPIDKEEGERKKEHDVIVKGRILLIIKPLYQSALLFMTPTIQVRDLVDGSSPPRTPGVLYSLCADMNIYFQTNALSLKSHHLSVVFFLGSM